MVVVVVVSVAVVEEAEGPMDPMGQAGSHRRLETRQAGSSYPAGRRGKWENEAAEGEGEEDRPSRSRCMEVGVPRRQPRSSRVPDPSQSVASKARWSLLKIADSPDRR